MKQRNNYKSIGHAVEGDVVVLHFANGMRALMDRSDADRFGVKWSLRPDKRGVMYLRHVKGDREPFLHRLVAGAAPGQLVDHINRDTLDNRQANVRVADKALNAHNSRRRAPSTSQFHGVTRLRSGRWQAQIKRDGRSRYLGSYASEAEAAAAYDRAAREVWGEAASTNFGRATA